jgi:signal transduction histidine kinase
VSPRFLRQLVGLAACSLGMATAAVPQSPQLPKLTHVAQIRELSADQSALHYPVRIRGIIIQELSPPDFTVQDATGGIFVIGSRSLTFPHHFGDLVELQGITCPGAFAPVVCEQGLRVLGSGTLPKTHLYSFSELADGREDGQWVQVRGVVRSIFVDHEIWHQTTLAMIVASGGGQFDVRVPVTSEMDFSSWIDKEVLIEGACGSLFNSENQLAGLLFYVPQLSFIKVFETPTKIVPFTELLRFSLPKDEGYRVRVRGVVAYQQPGNALFLQSNGKGLRVLTPEDTTVEAGDVVDAIGFPVLGESAPVLEDSVFHRVDHQAPPQPVELDLGTPLGRSWTRYDGALVTTNAKLLQYQQRADGLSLLFQQGSAVFDATMDPRFSPDLLRSISPGSELRITGICLVRSGGLWHSPESFHLLLRSPEDITVLHAPSWWNLRHTTWLLDLIALILFGVVAWVVVLGKRLREQMATIRQKLRSGAVLEERNRIARELHDTFEQEVAGITMQLDLAVDCFRNSPDVARTALEMARNMSRHSMIEARRSVWDLRCHLLENSDLVSAMTQVVEPLALGDGVQIVVSVEGHPTRLAPRIEINLLRIGQEAVTNAVKHSGARLITVGLEFNPEKVRVCVCDDGRGFRPDERVIYSGGHFGLLDMRERARFLGCHLQIESEPNCGTRIYVDVPVKPQQPSHEPTKVDTYSCR